jgi:RND family efflux transporter MFP subunit
MQKVVRYFLPLGLIFGSILVVVILVMIAQSGQPERKDEGPRPLAVDVIPAEVTSLNFAITSQGSVTPRTETILVAEVSGKVESVSPNFVAGGFFHEGEVLLQIDPSDYETGLKRADANLASRLAQLAEQKARSEQALKDWHNLGREGKPSDLTLRKPQLAEALANVQAAEAELLEAKRDLERTRIKVPYDGLVRKKQVDIGQYVSPGTPLGVTFSVDTAEIRLPLSSSEIAFMKLPSATRLDQAHRPPVRLTAENAGISGQWQAEIVRTEGVVDETSRVIYAVFEVKDPYGVLGVSDQEELKVGTFVRAEIEGHRVEKFIVLPRAVLRPDETLLVANKKRELEIREVTVLRTDLRNVYIGGGISDGELVITTSIEAPIPGTKLVITGEEPPASGLDSAGDDIVASAEVE